MTVHDGAVQGGWGKVGGGVDKPTGTLVSVAIPDLHTFSRAVDESLVLRNAVSHATLSPLPTLPTAACPVRPLVP